MTGVELIVSAILPVLLKRLTSPELLQFLRQEGLHSKIKTWEDNLKMIKAVLHDAEEKLKQEGVQEWLDHLEDLAYDVEDILDEFATDVLARDLKKKQHEQASTSKLRKLVSTKISKLSLKAVKSHVHMGSKMKDVKCRLEYVTSQLERLCKLKESLGLKKIVEGTSVAMSKPRPLTTSFATERAVYGREDDKAKILEMVFSNEPSATNFHVIPIVGMGGIGKTTLAQKVFNDEAVKSFELKAWVCVSIDFDVLKISKAIFENINGYSCNLDNLNVVQMQLHQKIVGKKFLFVLDDVWSKHHSLWENLSSPFRAGASGSKIIVTTRDETVASTMRSSTWLYRVHLLSNEDCWSLFKVHAFDDAVNPIHHNIQSIQEKVVEKCKGLPLASKVLGRLLYVRNIDVWLEILNNKMWDLEDESDIPATLKLSYFYLPSHLKRCFAYCSIFPEDYEFEKEELVHLWLTEGLIQPSKNKQLEDSGHDYFNHLLSSSLFQQSSSNKAKYVMHDLIKDLAQWASRGTCFHLANMSSVDDVNEQLKSLEKARHLSYGQGFCDGKCKFEVFSKVERVEQRLRTFLPLASTQLPYYNISPTIISDLLPKFKKLRMLSLENYQITKLPKSIGDLRHLRHLNLSGTRIKSLPESTSSLINLLILKLKGCSRLRKLPSEMRNLTKLRYLDIRGVCLNEMPLGIDELKDLRCLSNFIVGEGIGATLKVLRNLIFLRELYISRLENAIDLYETNEMILNNKQKLRVLELEWNSQFDDTCNAEKEKKVLNLLQPHRDLERLTIKSYGGIEFPAWVGLSAFSKLTVLALESCVNCTVLPSFGLLESLKDLTIRGMKGLKTIDNEFYGQQCSTPFQSLETLCFEDLQEWECWEPIKENAYGGAFPLLREFSIKSCPLLCGSLPSCLPSLEKLVIENCDQLVVSFSSLPKLCNLDINGCREMTCVDPINLKSLKSITLSNIEEFGNWAKQDYFHKADLVSFLAVCYFSNLCKLKITHCNALSSLPMEMNHRNTCLEHLELSECNSLKFIIDGPLPSSLKRLEIWRCDKLEYLWDDRAVSCTSVVDIENHTFVLDYLRVKDCTSLTNLSLSGRLPSTLSYLSLEALPELESIADSFYDNISLEESYIENYEKFTTISNGLHNCSCLQNVKLAEDGLPKDKLRSLFIYNCEKLEGLPKGFHSLDSLEDLTLYKCPSMRSFPEEGFPTNLTSLSIDGEVNIYKPLLEWGLHNLTILKTLRIYGRPNAESSFVEQEMGMRLPLSLTHLSIHEFPNSKWILSQDFRNLNSLERLEINDCPNLTSFPKVALPSSLQSLQIQSCPDLTSISELGLPSSLQFLDIWECPSLISVSELGLPSSLYSLDIWRSPALTSISELGLPSSLESLTISECPALTSISKLGLPSSLLELFIDNCSNLRFLTEQCLPSSLLQLHIINCAMLKEECKRDKGKVWFNISHIPRVVIDWKSIDELEDGE